jgi:hypothetical protein
MNDAGARPQGELDLEALACGDLVAASVLVELSRSNRILVLEPEVFAALRILFKDRPRGRAWEALLAQLGSVKVDVAALKRALRTADEEDAKQRDEELDEPQPDQGKDDTQAARLLAIADQHEYFCNDFGAPYMSVELPLSGGGSRLETIKIRSRRARLFLVHQYVSAFGKSPSGTAVVGVLEALEARASFGGVVHPVHIRHARRDGKIYLDRGTEDGSVYEIDKAGVRMLARSPVRFLRPAGMLPLPEAVFGDPKDGLRRLRELTLFRNERDSVLSVGFMLDALGGEGPYSVLLIIGEGGAAKSTLARMIVALVDPRLLPLLNAPASKRDLYISASTRALVAYNNLSYLDKDISDGLCTATEGGAESRRSLFTDDDESSIHAKAPFILVAIDNVVTRGDLASRTLKTDLAAFPPNVERLTDLEFWAKFDVAAPVVLGALLQALSVGLRRYDSLDQKGLPRLAAFAKFVIACETAFWDAGTFAEAFSESAESAADDVLSGDPIAAVFEEFMKGKEAWEGTATELLAELEAIVRMPERLAEMALALAKNEGRSGSKIPNGLRTEAEKAGDREVVRGVAAATTALKEAREHVRETLSRFPKAANALSARLRKIGPQLRGAGIKITWPTNHRDGKVLRIENAAIRDTKNISNDQQGSSSSSHRPILNEISGLGGDGLSAKILSESAPVSSASPDPDFLPDEPIQHDSPRDPPKPNSPFTEVPTKNSGHPSKLRDRGKGFEI